MEELSIKNTCSQNDFLIICPNALLRLPRDLCLKPETTQCEEITMLMHSIIMSSDHVKFQGCEITDTISRINLDILMGSYTILAPSPIKRKQ
jgi:hypothetical protein